MKINIVGVAPPYRGGIALHNAFLFKYLSKKHEVIFYNFLRQYPNLLFPGKTQFTNKSSLIIPSKRIIDSINPFTWHKTSNLIIKNNPDLVIFRTWNVFFCLMFGYIAKKIKKRSSIKTLVICDNILPHERTVFDKILMKSFLKKMDFHIVQSSIVEQELLNLLPNAIYKKLFHPIYDNFGSIQDKVKMKKKKSIKTKYVILYAGLVRSYKGFDILIQSIKHIKKKLDDFLVLAIGESYEDPKKYNSLVEKEGVSEFFFWENRYVPDDEIKEYFSICDVVALPYKTASQSGIIPIAYHFEKPVVVTSVGGLPEMVKNNKTGIVIEPNNPKVLGDVIAKNLKNDNFIKMSNNVKKFKKQFSWENFVRGIESLIKI